MTYNPRTYYFTISNSFDSKLLDKFLDILNSVPLEDNIEINVNSHGGEAAVMFFILRVINDNPDRFTIVVSGACDSAAFDLTLMADCKKLFLPNFVGGVAHSISFKAETRDMGNAESFSTLTNRAYLKVNKAIFNYFESLDMDSNKIAKLHKGEDIFFSREELIQACKYKEKNNIVFKGLVKE